MEESDWWPVEPCVEHGTLVRRCVLPCSQIFLDVGPNAEAETGQHSIS